MRHKKMFFLFSLPEKLFVTYSTTGCIRNVWLPVLFLGYCFSLSVSTKHHFFSKQPLAAGRLSCSVLLSSHPVSSLPPWVSVNLNRLQIIALAGNWDRGKCVRASKATQDSFLRIWREKIWGCRKRKLNFGLPTAKWAAAQNASERDSSI